MELTPGERMILRQLEGLYISTSRREHPLGKVTGQWPAMHVEAYRGVLGSLISKRLVELADEGRSLRITEPGMRAMGLAGDPETRRSIASAKAPPAPPVPLRTRRLGLVAQVVFIAFAVAALVLLWLVLWPR